MRNDALKKPIHGAGNEWNCPYSDFASCRRLPGDKGAENAEITANPTLFRAIKKRKASKMPPAAGAGEAGALPPVCIGPAARGKKLT